MYENGEGIEKDEKKKLYHLGLAAIGGHPFARRNLGCFEERNNRMSRADQRQLFTLGGCERGTLHVVLSHRSVLSSCLPYG